MSDHSNDVTIHGDPPAETDVRDVLRSYGWKLGPEFDARYYTDPWVFNLVNIIEKQQSEIARLRYRLEEEKKELPTK